VINPQFNLSLHDEIVIDNFAGGGGASTGIERALGRCVDEALNHDPKALAMHRMNHPQTVHHCEDIRMADPVKIADGRPVGLVWFSPDCKHFSKAKGGKPRDKNIRGLAWVVIRWVNKVAPRILILENVEEFQTWGPLEKDGNLKKALSGWFFKCFVGALRRRGYAVEYRELRACDYGAPTIRKRFFLIARRDGRPITWPLPTHGEGRVCSYRAVAECLDFTLPAPSIFLNREEGRAVSAKRPLAPATMQRVAKGIEKFVLKDGAPFIVCLTHQGGARVESVDIPAKTITAAHRGEKAFVQPRFACLTRYNVGAVGCDVKQPINTISARAGKGRTGGNGFGLVECKAAFTSYGQHGGHNRPAAEPCHTICANRKDTNQAVECKLAAPSIVKLRGTNIGQSSKTPLHTITASGAHHGVIACYVAQQNLGAVGRKGGAPLSTLTQSGSQQQLISCALVPYYGSETDGQSIKSPCRTVTTKDRFACAQTVFEVEPLTPEIAVKARAVAAWLRGYGVKIDGEFAQVGELVIYDVGLRMLTPRECYLAQGFPSDYIIDRGITCDEPHQVIALNRAEQMRMCGNSVCPPLSQALVRANFVEVNEERKAI